MNYVRTAVLLAAMTGLFLAVGFVIGGEAGMLVALAIAAAMNLFAYWNSDKVVLRMYGAREVDRDGAPQLYGIVETLAERWHVARLLAETDLQERLAALAPESLVA